MAEIIDVLEEELSEAVSNLVIEEGEDDQDKLREMILNLQIAAFNRGLTMNTGNERSVEERICAEAAIDSEEATAIVASLLREGSALISLVVRD